MRRQLLAAALIAVLALAGCASQPDDAYPAETAELLQAGVLSVTEAAATGDPQTALTLLDELQASLLDEFDSGTVDQARYDSITASITLVRADLELAVSQQVETSVDETEEPAAPGNSGNTGKPDKPGKPDKEDKPGKDD